MFDGRCNVGFRSYNAYQFSASYSDHSSVIFRVNPEFGYSEAYRVADKYAKELGNEEIHLQINNVIFPNFLC